MDGVGDLKAAVGQMASATPIMTIGKVLDRVGGAAQDAYAAGREKLTPVTTAAKKMIMGGRSGQAQKRTTTVPLPRIKGRAYGKGQPLSRGLSKGR